ncbi:hypothetical protein [Streptococcus sobrinus]|uniref:hypothetical protein n=1 Tax=Streptococcus sobrinus TaxID=1310 RepID=UPI000316A3E2|nr:hypothetical protein [Streptococcus sobrinus]
MTVDTDMVIVGAVKGRHDMPVKEFIFNEPITDPTNVGYIRQHIEKVLSEKIAILVGPGAALNQESYEDVLIRSGRKVLVLYVTGLTIITAEVIRFCALNGIALTLMHFDNVSGEYFSEKVF